MMNSVNSFLKLFDRAQSKPSKPIPKWWSVTFLIFGFLGFLDSTYLAAKHYLGFSVNCSILNGCEQVLNSSYATVFGVPVALMGAFYYLIIFLALIAYLDWKKFLFLKIAVILPISGFLFTLWLLVTQIFLLEAFCLYCLVSAVLTTGLFLLSLYLILSKRFLLYERKHNS